MRRGTLKPGDPFSHGAAFAGNGQGGGTLRGGPGFRGGVVGQVGEAGFQDKDPEVG